MISLLLLCLVVTAFALGRNYIVCEARLKRLNLIFKYRMEVFDKLRELKSSKAVIDAWRDSANLAYTDKEDYFKQMFQLSKWTFDDFYPDFYKEFPKQ